MTNTELHLDERFIYVYVAIATVDCIVFIGSLFLKQAGWLNLVVHGICWREKASFMEWLVMLDLFRMLYIS